MNKRVCFIVMPFRGELNYFFLYIQKYLHERHGLDVRRGDTDILTKALMEKIESEIQAADLIIGDITHPNPNVFYELGLARANRKPIIFLTQDDPEKAPVALRPFEFIKYDLAKHQDLLTKLDNAIANAFGQGYQKLYGTAMSLLQSFNNDTVSTYGPATFEEFQARVMRGERAEGIPEGVALREFLLPKIVAEATDMTVIRKLEKWLSEKEQSHYSGRRKRPTKRDVVPAARRKR